MAQSRVSRVSTAVRLAWLVMMGAALTAGTTGTAAAQAPPALGLTVNDAAIVFGESLRVGVTVANPGGAPAADFVFALLLPDGATIVSAGPGIGVRFGRLSDLRSIVPVVRGVPLAAPFRFQEPSFFNYTFSGIEPQGTYRILFAAFSAGALDDGAIGAGELLALTARDFTVSAAPPLTTTDPARKVTTVVPRSGGTVQTTNAAGATLTLTVPANAVPADTTISITPLTTFQDLQLGPLVSGVSLEPSGLTFATPATLTITLPTGYVVPQLGLAGFLADGAGRNLQPVPATVSGRVVTLSVPHFSTSGVALDDSRFEIACDMTRITPSPEKVTACGNLRPLFTAEMDRLAREGGDLDTEFLEIVIVELGRWFVNGLDDRIFDAATPDPADPFRKAQAVGEEFVDWTSVLEPLFGITDRTNAARLNARPILTAFGQIIDMGQTRFRTALLAAMNAINVKCLAEKPTVNDRVNEVLLLRAYWALQFPGPGPEIFLPFDEIFCVDIRIDAAPPPVLAIGSGVEMPIDMRVRYIDGVELPGLQVVVSITATDAAVSPAGGTLATPIARTVTVTPAATSSVVTIRAAFGVTPNYTSFQYLPARTKVFNAGQPAADLTFTNGNLEARGTMSRLTGPALEVSQVSPQLSGTATVGAGIPDTTVVGSTGRGYSGATSASATRSISRTTGSAVVSFAGQASAALSLVNGYTGSGFITAGAGDGWCMQLSAPVSLSAVSVGATNFFIANSVLGETIELRSQSTPRLAAGRWCFLYSGEVGRQAAGGEIFGDVARSFSYTLTFSGVR